jgi:RNA polymerase sigma-70 factor, ECF subfamily
MTNTDRSGIEAKPPLPGHAEPPHLSEAKRSEQQMIAAARSGERAALESLLGAVRPRLVAVALKMVRDPDDAEDVVQEALMKVWKHVGRFEGRAAFSTWLHRIVVNTSLDHLRTRRHTAVAAHASEPAPAPGRDRELIDGAPRAAETVDRETPEDLLGRAEVGAIVRGAIAKLSPVHREVLILRELDGESYQAIAARARCPIGTVMSRLHNARHRLEQTLTDDTFPSLRQAA